MTTTTIINTVDAKEQFSDLINRVAHSKERIIFTRRGKEVAVLISLEDFKLLEDSRDKHDLADAIDALQDARNTGTLTLEQLKETLGS